MKKIIVILGTRPEAIKLAPVILQLREDPRFSVAVCNTEQQKELSNQTLGFFGIRADYTLDVMRPNQSLGGVHSRLLAALSRVYADNDYDGTIVQGDTMTVFSGALVSFYNRRPVFHIEAGLRSHDLLEPFPEEAIRQMVTRITTLHFAPTRLAYDMLRKEGVPDQAIRLTGNTVIDALRCLSPATLREAKSALAERGIRLNDTLVLVTVHRRENHGERLRTILACIAELSRVFPDHQFVVPVHPNPNVHDAVHEKLAGRPNVVLCEPLDYPHLVSLMEAAKLILTDSGGIQEEAPSFGVPVLVLRYETERSEGVQAGYAKLVGADEKVIMEQAACILAQDKPRTRLDSSTNPYGTGRSAEAIRAAIAGYYGLA